MGPTSYTDVFALTPALNPDCDVQPGDLVRTGPNHFPYFRVVAVSQGRAWIRDVASGADGLVDLARCTRVERPAEAENL